MLSYFVTRIWSLLLVLLYVLMPSLAESSDINGDGNIDQRDLLLFLSEWHIKDFSSPADFYTDGFVNYLDLWLFSSLWDPKTDDLSLFPASTTMIAGDSLQFAALYRKLRPLDLEYRVDGIVGGNSAVGTIQPGSVNPFFALYTAPETIDGLKQVAIISVNDAKDKTLSATAALTIHPRIGKYLIQPAAVDLGLEATTVFQAGMSINDVGFIPLNQIYWKVNDVLHGKFDTGKIDITGVYKAPPQMPALLPYSLIVSYSLAPDDRSVAEAPVILSELHAIPRSVIHLQPGPAEVIDASLAKSDNTFLPLAPADLRFNPDLPNVASVNAKGQITIGDKLGRAIIAIEEKNTHAKDTLVADSRSDIDFKAEIQQRSRDFARIERTNNQATEIEFTRPGALFNFTPIATILRGDNAGDSLSTVGSTVVFSAQEDDIVVYDPNEPIPDGKGKTALIDRETGFTVIGDKPGRGTLIAHFDDGFVQKSANLDVIFSRIKMDISVMGQITQKTNEALITEYILVQVVFTNPNSSFFGDVPLRMTLLDEQDKPESFRAAYHRNKHTGNGAIKTNANNFFPFQFNDFTEFDLTADSSFRPKDFVDEAGVFEFLISPRRTGMHRFKFEVRNDPGVESQIFSINVIKPKMVLQYPPSIYSAKTNFIPDDSPVVMNSWVNVYHRAPESALSPFDLVQQKDTNTFSRFAHNDAVLWTITDPYGKVETLPITDMFNTSAIFNGGTFSRIFDQPGNWKIRHALQSRPEIQTEELTVNVVLPQDVQKISDADILPVTDEDSKYIVPRSNQLGVFSIESPVSGGWAPGIPIPVTIQCYSAQGEPKPIGKTVYSEYYYNSDSGLKLSSKDTRQLVVGLNVDFLFNYNFTIEGNLRPNSQGKIQFNIIPTEQAQANIGQDLILMLIPQTYSIVDEELFISGLPTETRRYVDGEGGILEAAPFGITQYIKEANRLSNRPCLFVSGAGLAVSPRQLPVPSSRVENAVAAKQIPSASQYSILTLYGNPKFGKSLASGLTTISYNDETGVRNIPIIHSETLDNNRLKVTLDLRAEDLGERFWEVVLGDQTRWKAVFELIKCSIAEPETINHSDKNLPLNARHHNAHEIGSQQFDVRNETPNTVLHKLELELRPSIKEGDTYKGEIATSPLVGFDREIDKQTGQLRVYNLKQDFFQRNFSAFMVYGNIADRRTLNSQGTQLIPDSNPDNLPDFVSLSPNAEKLLITLNGNLADYYEYTAYNLIASVTADLQDPVLGFDDIKNNINTAYAKYAGPDESQTVGEIDKQMGGRGVSVNVDQEAPLGQWDSFNNTLQSAVPDNYYAGVLDQFYLKKMLYRIAQEPKSIPIGQGGRVRAFNGERNQGLNVTQRNRRGFGIELDAVLFDPMMDGIFDFDPNSAPLLNIPVVRNSNASGASLSNLGLFPEQGGTSGGYFDLDKEYAGSHMAAAKTPGVEFPGIHAGYLIQDTTAILTDPYFGSDKSPSIENDIEQVLIKRDAIGNRVEGTPILEEKAWFKLFGQIEQRRRVLGFCSDRDKKKPIGTSIFTNFKYQITTDPPAVKTGIPVVASIWLREIPRSPEEQINLLVATQSDGSESLQKGAIDFVIDMSVNVASQVVLAALTGGTANLTCGGLDMADALFTASLNFALATTESQYFDNQLDSKTSGAFRVVNSVLRDGQSFIPYLDSVQVSVSDFGIYPEWKELKEGVKDIPKAWRGIKDSVYKAPGKVSQVGICSIINAPFQALKTALKDSFSPEGLGGNGAAEAIGERHICVSIPQSAWREGPDKLYTAEYSIRRVIDIIPKEPGVRKLSDEQFPSEYNTDAAVESDIELIERLLTDLNNPLKKTQAENILRLINRTSISRESPSYSNVYREHKLRYGRLPSFEIIMTPKSELEPGGKRIGDFMLQTDKTAINVAAGSMVMVSRTNENAGARAVLTSNGYEMRLLQANIPDPYQAMPIKTMTRQMDSENDFGHTCAGTTHYDKVK